MACRNGHIYIPNPEFVVSGFVKAGISRALDGFEESDASETSVNNSDSDADGSDSDVDSICSSELESQCET